MGLFSFIANAGKKLFGGHRDTDAGQAIQQLDSQQIQALQQHVASLGLNISNLGVQFTGPGEVTLTGEAASQADYEKAALMAGNVMGITRVNNKMTVAQQLAAEPEAQTYEIKKGDTLWGIAEKYYGKGADYPRIVQANQPMIKDADEIYPGQVLRIPK